MLDRLEQAVRDRNKGKQLPREVTDDRTMNEAVGYLMGAVRAVMYRNGSEPSRGSAGRDVTVLRNLLLESDPDWLLQAILGVVYMRDTGQLRPLCEPGEPMTTRVLAIKWGNRPLLVVAREAYEKASARQGARGPRAGVARLRFA